jgi:hypothetical protein
MTRARSATSSDSRRGAVSEMGTDRDQADDRIHRSVAADRTIRLATGGGDIMGTRFRLDRC